MQITVRLVYKSRENTSGWERHHSAVPRSKLALISAVYLS